MLKTELQLELLKEQKQNADNGGNNGTVYDADYKVEDDGNNDNK